jgi:hypothetical protein
LTVLLGDPEAWSFGGNVAPVEPPVCALVVPPIGDFERLAAEALPQARRPGIYQLTMRNSAPDR